ncbi:MAG: fatty acid--CoA ligase [Cytophagaceae bacterium]|nr:fatty acid--CoA ligase [Cytophagaceae bacterium]
MNLRKIAPASNAFAFPLLIKSLLNNSKLLEPEREIVYRDRTRYNYFELHKRVAKLANVFKNLGLNGGETIAVMDYDSHRYLESFFAIPMTGHVIHTINWRLSPTQILYTINHAEDVVIIAHADFVPLLTQLAAQFTTVRQVIVAVEDTPMPDTTLPVAGEYEELLAGASDEYDFEDFDEDAVATTFYTTGTTGNPKGVFFTHRQIVLHTLAIAINFSSTAAACRINNADVYMPLTPFFHVHAWGFPFLATMLNMKQVFVGKFEPEMTLKLFMQHKPTLSHCVPTILQMFVSHPATQAVDMSGWKVIIGGSALPKSLAKAVLQRGIDVVTAYGMSETCPLLTTIYLSNQDKARLDPDAQVAARTRTGTAAVLVDLRVVDEAGNDVPLDDETMGEVVVRAPWLTQGYFKEPEKSEELWRGGWLHTGDVATMDARRSIKIADRIKDVIKTGGEWVSSIDLESLIGLHPAVQEVAVVGIPDAKWGERPHASIVLKAGQQATIEHIKAHLEPFVERGTINKWTVPESIAFVEAIPKTSVGKIDKKVIRAGLLVV